MRNTKRKTTKQFIEEAKEIHGNKYDYSKVKYINQLTKICIICPEHGEFWQTPKCHLACRGCYECAKKKFGKGGKRGKIVGNTFRDRKIKEEKERKKRRKRYEIKKPVDTMAFIEEARKIHDDKYDYSNVKYVNNKTKVCIICPEHGEFWQEPYRHLALGSGCPKCARKNNGNLQRIAKDDFIKFADEKWDNKYDYSKCEYIDYHTKIHIICPEHGEFWQTPLQHLKACGCSKCVSEHKHNLFSSNANEFIEKAKKIFHCKYSYEHVKYINNATKVIITCPKHGDFLCTPANHLKGRGCPICKTEHYVYEERLYNLLLEIFNKDEIQRQVRFEWLSNYKSLDFYMPKYKLAIEHQGSQHFMYGTYWGGKEKFLKNVANDKQKYKECQDNGIRLLYFAYEVNTVPEHYIDTVYTDENKFINVLKEIKMGKAISLDLGSTLSEVAVIENGKPVVIANEEGSYTTPSVISLKDKSPKVGGAAKRQMLTAPKETVNLIKRFMGGTYDEVQDAIKHVQYDVVNDNGLPRILINGRKYSPEELSSMIVAKMKKVAEDYLGEEVKDIVITVPAFFSDAAKSATKQAGELAGLNVLRIISEPTAALLASNIDKVKGGKYLVVDFGGSTTDFSVADISDNVIEILASYGDVYLGGTDIDKMVSDYLVKQFKEDNGIDLSDDTMAMSRIVEASEKAKIELSNSASTDINLPYITAKNGTPIHMVTTLTKAKFENLIKPIVDRVVNCGKVALEKAKLTSNDLDGVLLVGGSCRIPIVQDELKKTFGDKLIKSANLDLAVAEGGAIQANTLSGGESDILLLDVTPLRLGLETEGGVMTTLIEENTTIPCRKEQIFSTAEDNQTAITVRVLQGSRPLAKDNKEIGLFNLDGIAPTKRGIPKISIKFDINADGILSVSATDMATNKGQHITIESKNTLSQEEIDRIKREAQEHEEEDKKTKERLGKINKIDGIIYQTESFVEEYKDKSDILTEDDKKYFNEKVDELKKCKDGDLSNADSLITEVNNRMMTCGGRAYANNNAQGNSSNGSFDAFKFAESFGGKNGSFNGAATSNVNTTNDSKPEDVEEV